MKSLTYAYATSPDADKYNKGKGCWLVQDHEDHAPYVFQDDEKWQALEYFESLDVPIDKHRSFTRNSLPFQA